MPCNDVNIVSVISGSEVTTRYHTATVLPSMCGRSVKSAVRLATTGCGKKSNPLSYFANF